MSTFVDPAAKPFRVRAEYVEKCTFDNFLFTGRNFFVMQNCKYQPIIGSAEALPILCVSDFFDRERERETPVTSLISR